MVEEELYGLEDDPYETVNLIESKDFDTVHERLNDRLTEWIKSSKGLRTDVDAILEHFKVYGITKFKMEAKSILNM